MNSPWQGLTVISLSARLLEKDFLPTCLLDVLKAIAMPELVQTTNLRGH
jgi:hypothetical protein